MENKDKINFDLDFLDKNAKEKPKDKPKSKDPNWVFHKDNPDAKAYKAPSSFNPYGLSDTQKKWAWGLGIVLVLIIVGALSGSGNSTSTPSAPSTTSSSNSNLIGASGQTYSCTDDNYNQATALEPDPATVASLNTESAELDSRQTALNTESAQVDAMYVDQSDQTSLDTYNAAVNGYNAKLNQLKADDASWNQRNTALNTQIDTYNNFLNANCTPD